jgi:hypothetical protein
MATQIFALDRGGWSAYGSATTDPRNRQVILQADEDEEHQITVTFQSNVSSVTRSENGITSTTPSISGATFTAELTEADSSGYIEFSATLSSGEIKKLRIRGRGRSSMESDYGRYWG